MFNTAWPVSLGGTGGTTVITSWDAITAKGTDVASASTIVLTTATGPRIDITGTTSITAVTLAAGSWRLARATGIFTLTASASLLVNKSASVNYTTAVGDLLIFQADASVVSVTVIGNSTNPALTSNAALINFAIGTPTVAASALTIPFTGLDGNVIAAANIAYVNFRSATAGSGAIAQLALTSAQSLVVPSGASLGSVSAVATTYALAAFNNAGSIIYGIINPVTLPLVDGIATTTLLSGSSTSAGVWYTTTALTSKAYTIIGYFTATEATAGTWATAPSAVQVATSSVVSNLFSRVVLGTSTATTSGTTIDFTGIPSWARRVVVNFTGVSTNGTSSYIVQIGDSGGIENSGYLGASSNVFSASGSSAFTDGFGIVAGGAGVTIHGSIIISLSDVVNNTWDAFGILGRSDSAVTIQTGGSKSLSPGPLDRIRLTTENGTDTFDAGKINISYE